jgi:twitching motility protein PilT
MIERINEERAAHVVTLERPIEHVHRNRKSLVRQHEVKTFADALGDVRREDPDVVVVGELRDPDAIALAIELANAGVLVIGVVEALDSASAIDRLVEVFPIERQAQVRGQLRHTLKGAIAQRLLPRIGGGRILACETMIRGSLTTTMTDSLRNLAHERLIESSGLV